MPGAGLHHITALTGNAAQNLHFYQRVLGLRLVKRTVNFDDPATWHLYYGDHSGRPGTLLTFFVFPGLPRGRHGTGQAVEIGFAIGRASLAHWVGRLTEHRVDFEGPFDRLEERVLRFSDPEGLQLELVTSAGSSPAEDARGGAIDHAIRGLHGVTLWEEVSARTAHLLSGRLGFARGEDADARVRLALPTTGIGSIVDIRTIGEFWPGSSGAGTVHHIAFRAFDVGDQAQIRQHLIEDGLDVTPTLDRVYFRSIYFREPGGVLFEVATDGPGFAVDEPIDTMGTTLKLPPWLETQRATIERSLPSLDPGPVDPLFDYRFFASVASRRPFAVVTLHGTGGDERSLVPFAQAVAPGAAIISPRGRVIENGSARFFRRLADGMLDVDDLRERAVEFADFLSRAARHNQIGTVPLFAIGYSNGANMAAATLILRPDTFAGAVLLRPMMIPVEAPSGRALAGQRILIVSGRADRAVPPDHPEALKKALENAGADVVLASIDADHEISNRDLSTVTAWFEHLVNDRLEPTSRQE